MKRKNIRLLIFYIVAWTLSFAFFIFLNRELGNSNLENYLNENKQRDISVFATIVYQSISMGCLAGIIFAVIDLYIAKYYRNFLSLGLFFILITMLNLAALGIVIYFSIYSINQLLKVNITMNDFAVDIHVFVVYGFMVNFLVSFVREMDRKLGSGNLWKLIIGKFYKPRQIERIFMFIDLQSSTRIAEEIGNIRYSRLLRDCFKDLAVVADYSAEVYQYVGDEVVLNWNPVKGLKKNNFLHSFYAFQKTIDERADYYMEHYGVKPIFKASAHIGQVTVTEVGELKSEICYHGDILNTTSRIQALCSVFNNNMLISERLKNRMEKDDSFVLTPLGLHSLKGKVEKVSIWKTEQHAS